MAKTNTKAAALKDMRGEFNGRAICEFDNNFDFGWFYGDVFNWSMERMLSGLDLDYSGNERDYALIA